MAKKGRGKSDNKNDYIVSAACGQLAYCPDLSGREFVSEAEKKPKLHDPRDGHAPLSAGGTSVFCYGSALLSPVLFRTCKPGGCRVQQGEEENLRSCGGGA